MGFITGICLLYGTKVFKTGLHPMDVNCYPFTNQPFKPLEKKMSVNIFRTNDPKEKIDKAESLFFDYDLNQDMY